ncbi:MAG: rod shape-determining protein [Candidatus Taylorbacteria bacterium RIFCSPHIGHO2_02_FULL_46_13]|uniref:Cell shape-determining protein MreB n=1 Tax=Candidatus Taylorbacteria bacterium RIFCSPHIGHO2_02_FULL_46_13 TaxID=1802312 RepID=A0A1G2MPR9_9BACT|nr:MAG: rod shape-determining protein [Candidatus Taylorbacteria bacterium RIFCSPHIGHO2_02_FULL_46_13]
MFKDQLERLYHLFSHDLGIDLGTANTLVYVRGQGIVINEPSVVAINQKTGTVVAVGNQAKAMLGRTPQHINAIRPLIEGVISDFEVTEEMIAYLINKVQQGSHRFVGPRVVVGVPSGVTNVESRAVRDATRNSGAREVHIVEQPMAAAIGIRLPIKEPIGSMVIDIGGGTTDIAVISLGGIVRSKNLKIAGDHFNNDIIAYIRNEFKILIGEKTAEHVKISIGSAMPFGSSLETVVKGRDLVTGLPREVIITDADVREALAQSVDSIVEATREVLETTPPELISDVMQRGIHLVGGGALLKGIAPLLEQSFRIPIYVADDPLTAVARGAGIILEDMERFKETLIQHEEDLPFQK